MNRRWEIFLIALGGLFVSLLALGVTLLLMSTNGGTCR